MIQTAAYGVAEPVHYIVALAVFEVIEDHCAGPRENEDTTEEKRGNLPQVEEDANERLQSLAYLCGMNPPRPPAQRRVDSEAATVNRPRLSPVICQLYNVTDGRKTSLPSTQSLIPRGPGSGTLKQTPKPCVLPE